jgi:hypothetical protein
MVGLDTSGYIDHIHLSIYLLALNAYSYIRFLN